MVVLLVWNGHKIAEETFQKSMKISYETLTELKLWFGTIILKIGPTSENTWLKCAATKLLACDNTH